MLPELVLPESLQHEALSLLADTSADAAEERAEIADRAEPFTRSGFPVPLDPLAARRGPAAFVPAAGVAVALLAVFGGGAMLAASTLHHATPPVSSAIASAVPSAKAGTASQPVIHSSSAKPTKSKHTTPPPPASTITPPASPTDTGSPTGSG